MDEVAVNYNPNLDLEEIDQPPVAAAGAVAADDAQLGSMHLEEFHCCRERGSSN